MSTKQIAEFNICYRAFIRLLKNKHLYSQYLKNIGRSGASASMYRVQDIIDFAHNRETNVVAQRILSRAFSWSMTREDNVCWRMIHTEWIRNYLGIESDECSGEFSSTLEIPLRKQI